MELTVAADPWPDHHHRKTGSCLRSRHCSPGKLFRANSLPVAARPTLMSGPPLFADWTMSRSAPLILFVSVRVGNATPSVLSEGMLGASSIRVLPRGNSPVASPDLPEEVR